jgi:NADH-dependent peroxiredoxin subunit F
MLDNDLKEQLHTHFQGLGHLIELVIDRSEHAQHAELLEMLNDLASTSDEIKVRVSEQSADMPQFSVYRDGKPTGVHFKGIPGGHEFTSLILAILNSAGKGKLPDAGLAKRIQQLNGAKVRTYISLSCENCPDIVQALNLMALTHGGGLEHTMIDGAFVQEELERLNVQGVPAVFVGDELVHSGRSTFAELLTKLEAAVGRNEASMTQNIDLGHFDVAVMGGGPAGASAAIYSVRKGLKTVLIAEKLGGQVQETKGIENLISVVYTEGPQLAANLDKHLRSYPVEVLEHRRVHEVIAGKDGGRTTLRLESGEHLTTDALIVATGAKWRELGVPGEKEYIGRGVAFCPHCDGPYYKGKKVSVVGGGNSGVEAAIDLAGICTEVVLFEFMETLKADDVLIKKLHSLPNVKVITYAKTMEVIGNGEKVIAIDYQDRATHETHRVELDGVFVQIGLSPNSAVVKNVVETNRFGEIVVDTKGHTSTAGIYAAGDVTTVPFKQIIIAMGEGAKAALTAFEDRMRAGEKPNAQATTAQAPQATAASVSA